MQGVSASSGQVAPLAKRALAARATPYCRYSTWSGGGFGWKGVAMKPPVGSTGVAPSSGRSDADVLPALAGAGAVASGGVAGRGVLDGEGGSLGIADGSTGGRAIAPAATLDAASAVAEATACLTDHRLKEIPMSQHRIASLRSLATRLSYQIVGARTGLAASPT